MKIEGLEKLTVARNAFETYIKQLNKVIKHDDGKNPTLTSTIKRQLSEAEELLAELTESFNQTFNQAVDARIASGKVEKLN